MHACLFTLLDTQSVSLEQIPKLWHYILIEHNIDFYDLTSFEIIDKLEINFVLIWYFSIWSPSEHLHSVIILAE